MRDTDINPCASQLAALQHTPSLEYPAGHAHKASAVQHETRKAGLVQRVIQFFARLFGSRRTTELTAADRAKAAREAQLPPPLAFKGDTTNTLATPMGAYAGKPVEQVLRKRAEQQFKNMDITRATIN